MLNKVPKDDQKKVVVSLSLGSLILLIPLAVLISGVIVGSPKQTFVGALLLFICVVIPVIAMIAQVHPLVGAALFLGACFVLSSVAQALGFE